MGWNVIQYGHRIDRYDVLFYLDRSPIMEYIRIAMKSQDDNYIRVCISDDDGACSEASTYASGKERIDLGRIRNRGYAVDSESEPAGIVNRAMLERIMDGATRLAEGQIKSILPVIDEFDGSNVLFVNYVDDADESFIRAAILNAVMVEFFDSNVNLPTSNRRLGGFASIANILHRLFAGSIIDSVRDSRRRPLISTSNKWVQYV